MGSWAGLIDRYRDYLPVTGKTPVVTLYEGNTPLLKADCLADRLNQKIDLYLKYDGANPTGSFKDRGMTMAISKALEVGSKAVICASTGNTSAAASAYAARAGIGAVVIIPAGGIALGKLAQAVAHGARVIQIEGNFDDALGIVREVAGRLPAALVNSINPYRIEGQKTAAFEVCDVLGGPPDYHALPVGNAGNITAYWKGYSEYLDEGRISSAPAMLGFQASGAAPIVRGEPVEHPETVATAIRIGNPANWKAAEAAIDESGGRIEAVTDEEILSAYRAVAVSEGVFCEPASAASIAGVIKLAERGYFSTGARVVCTLTGHGLKDPESAISSSEEPVRADAGVEDVLELIQDIL